PSKDKRQHWNPLPRKVRQRPFSCCLFVLAKIRNVCLFFLWSPNGGQTYSPWPRLSRLMGEFVGARHQKHAFFHTKIPASQLLILFQGGTAHLCSPKSYQTIPMQ